MVKVCENTIFTWILLDIYIYISYIYIHILYIYISYIYTYLIYIHISYIYIQRILFQYPQINTWVLWEAIFFQTYWHRFLEPTSISWTFQDFVYRLSTERPELEVTLNGGVSWQQRGAYVTDGIQFLWHSIPQSFLSKSWSNLTRLYTLRQSNIAMDNPHFQ